MEQLILSAEAKHATTPNSFYSARNYFIALNVGHFNVICNS